MINLNTNLSSLITQRSLAKSTLRLNQAIEQMTTGFKINHAKDNAANYNITTNMTTKIGAYMVAEDNCAMGLDLLATANESLDQITDKLQRLRALAVQTSNGTSSSNTIGYVQEAVKAEATALVDEIERLYNTTEYNGISVMKGQVDGVEESKFIKDIDRRDTSNMMTLASVDETKALTSGTYSISTPEELAKLATMTNNGLIKESTEFVLAADIDLKDYSDWIPIGVTDFDHSFRASFDGNGYIVSNMTIISNGNAVGLFGKGSSCYIRNLGVEVSSISNGGTDCGLLIGYLSGFGELDNCYTTGSVNAQVDVGGLAGIVGGHETIVKSCYSEADIVANRNFAGGLIGDTTDAVTISNSYATGDVVGMSLVGGLVGCLRGSADSVCALGNVTATSGASSYGPICGEIRGGILNSVVGSISNCALINFRSGETLFHVGVSAGQSSTIDLDLGFDLAGVNSLRTLMDANYIDQIDLILKVLNVKQVELGAAQNRLESALDEISVQYENLVSSRSTLRDADISEVSSEYIRQQILQQASATLMATANQSPSIALQLI